MFDDADIEMSASVAWHEETTWTAVSFLVSGIFPVDEEDVEREEKEEDDGLEKGRSDKQKRGGWANCWLCRIWCRERECRCWEECRGVQVCRCRVGWQLTLGSWWCVG